MVCFSEVLDIGWVEDPQMIKDKLQVDLKQICRVISRFKGKLIKMIKHVNIKFDNYSISHKIRQILSHWSYELVESDLL